MCLLMAPKCDAVYCKAVREVLCLRALPPDLRGLFVWWSTVCSTVGCGSVGCEDIEEPFLAPQ